ncbi:MAG: hypothetical protein AAFX08_07925 [Pseudomonadota bacterium]
MRQESFERHFVLGLMYPASLGSMLYSIVPRTFDLSFRFLNADFLYALFILIYFIGDYYYVWLTARYRKLSAAIDCVIILFVTRIFFVIQSEEQESRRESVFLILVVHLFFISYGVLNKRRVTVYFNSLVALYCLTWLLSDASEALFFFLILSMANALSAKIFIAARENRQSSIAPAADRSTKT